MTVIGSATLELLGDSAQFRQEMDRAKAVTVKFGQDLQNIGGMLTKAVSLPLLAVGTGAVIAATKMDTLKRALVAVAGSTEAADRQLVDLKEAAKLPGLGFAEAIEGSVRLQAVGVEAGRATRLLKAFGNAIATTGGGKTELQRVTVQLGQLSAKGKILAQDLRPIIEAAPAVGRALREAFGTVDAQEIEELGLTTDQFLDRLVSQLERLPAVTGGPKNAFENLKDSLLQAGDAVGRIMLPTVTRLTELLTQLLESIASLDPKFLKFAVTLGIVAAAIGPLLTVAGRLTTVLGLMGIVVSPVGVIVTGIAAVLAGLGLWKLATQGQTAAQAQLNTALDDFRLVLSKVGPGKQIETARAFYAAIESDLKKQERRLGVLRALHSKLPPIGRAGFDEWVKQNEAIEAQQRLVNDLRGRLEAVGQTVDQLSPLPTPKPIGDGEKDNRVQETRNAIEAAYQALQREGIALTTRLQTPIEQRNAAIAEANILLTAGTISEETHTRALKAAQDAYFQTTEAGQRWVGLLNAQQQILLAIQSPMQTYMEQVNQLLQVFFAGLLTIEEFGLYLDVITERFRAATSEGQRMGNTVAEAGVQMATSFADFAASGTQSFHEFTQAVLRDIARMIARFLVLKAVAGFLTAINPAAGAAFSAAAGFGRRASGGPVRPGQPYMVGERGRELFVPDTAGRIVANNAMGGTLRLDTSSLPARPGTLSPEALATEDWWRRAYSHLKLDYDERGGL